MKADSDGAVLQVIQKKLADRQFEKALSELSEVLGRAPDSPDALYMDAVCKRYLHRFEDAQGTLDHLQRVAPESGRAYQEQGHLYRDRGEPEKALRAYQHACELNPALLASWRARVEILRKIGQQAVAVRIKKQLRQLEQTPDALRAVIDLSSEGKLLKAEKICRKFLQANPRHVQGMQLLADIAVRQEILDDAEFLLESAVAFEPANQQARIAYIQVLRKRQKFSQAQQQTELLLDAEPDSPQFQSLHAIVCMQLGDFDRAQTYFNRVLEQLPGDANTMTSKGHACKTTGQYQDAVAAYRGALEGHPRHGEAWYSLANLKTYKFSTADIAAMLRLAQDETLHVMDRTYLNFALGKAYEDLADYSTSFAHYRAGNDLKTSQSKYSAEKISSDFAAQRQFFSETFFQEHRQTGETASDPIFIVGLPRAGSTLLEQILSSHSQVDGTHELPNILSLSQRLRRRARSASVGYPEMIARIDAGELQEFGERYIADTRIHRRGAPFFIDKMPNNFRHIGLIRLILPNAKIIDARRNPMACCFSGYKQLFAEGQEFSYALGDIGRYYRDYVELMDHWDTVLPGFVLRVRHEDVVADLESQVRRILDFCGLPFEPACLEFYKTERNVRTPSSEQVRRPIDASANEQWRNFSEFLQPLRDALGPVLERYPETEEISYG